MAIKLNLLPPDYTVSGSTAKTLKALRSLGVISIAAFVVFALIIVGFFIVSSIESNNLNASINSLTSQIKSQEQTEQKVVLLKDRLKKIKAIQANSGSIDNLDKAGEVVDKLGPDATLTEFSVDPDKVDLSVAFRTNSDLTNFLSELTATKAFKSVVLTSFGFNPTSGYLVGVRLM